ncbi:GNAT family N-acetyltransferase (plasmid) [Kitasatospora sp. NBC_00070]|uniref:GNAT family N-acetyltransferase n=1 Tax=Kitasatospora sp. NBC_00070 TaxID=2975962 RepID=UPI002F9084E0
MSARLPEPVVLTGGRIRVEPLSRRHLADLFAAAGGDEEVWRWLPVATPRTVDELDAFLRARIAEMERGERVVFAVVELAGGQAVGSTSFQRFNLADESVEGGWTWYGRAAWRTGANLETKLLTLTHAFEELGMNRVAWQTDHLNDRSRTSLLRLGARYEGTHRADRKRADGTFRDSDYFSMLRDEWPAAKEDLRARLGVAEGTAGGGL